MTDAALLSTPLDHQHRFQLVSIMGHGSYSTVYRAIDTQCKQEVAIKVLPLRGLHSGKASHLRAYLRREVVNHM